VLSSAFLPVSVFLPVLSSDVFVAVVFVFLVLLVLELHLATVLLFGECLCVVWIVGEGIQEKLCRPLLGR